RRDGSPSSTRSGRAPRDTSSCRRRASRRSTRPTCSARSRTRRWTCSRDGADGSATHDHRRGGDRRAAVTVSTAVRRAWTGVFVVAGFGLAVIVGFVAAAPSVPTFATVRAAHRPSDVPLLDRRGAVLDELRTDRGARRLAWTPLVDVSPALVQAVIA